MSALPLSLALDDHALEAIAQRVAAILTDQAPEADPLLTVEEAADYLRCKPPRIYDLTSQGKLRVHKDGARSLYRRSSLDAVLEAS